MFCLPIKFINGWLFKIDVSRYQGPMRSKLIRYQLDCYEVLYERFCRRPSAPTDLVPREKIEEQERALMEMREKVSTQVQNIKQNIRRQTEKLYAEIESQRRDMIRYLGNTFVRAHKEIADCLGKEIQNLAKRIETIEMNLATSRPTPRLPIKIVRHPNAPIRCITLDGQVMVLAEDFLKACRIEEGDTRKNLEGMGLLPGSHFVEIGREKLAAHYGTNQQNLQHHLDMPELPETLILITATAIPVIGGTFPGFAEFYKNAILSSAFDLLCLYLDRTGKSR
jgi:chaperonin cofactor prefoldin